MLKELLLLLVLSTEPSTCPLVENHIKDHQSLLENVEVFQIYKGPRVQEFLEDFNSMEPKSSVVGDTIYLLYSPLAGNVGHVDISLGSCMVGHLNVNLKEFWEYMNE